jgi:hypothetical protein
MIEKLRLKYPAIQFIPSERYSFISHKNTITYIKSDDNIIGQHSLLHEVAHAILEHNNYKNDINLLKIERDAWTLTKRLLKEHRIDIDKEHIEDCLDTYRDWIYKRSVCPRCSHVGFQTSKTSYDCVFCVVSWNVPESRLCMVKRTLARP